MRVGGPKIRTRRTIGPIVLPPKMQDPLFCLYSSLAALSLTAFCHQAFAPNHQAD